MNKSTSRFLFLLAFCLASIFCFAQTKRVITGVVKDEKGNPLQGVSYLIKGGATLGSTDALGYYRVAITGKTATLVFTHIGYVTQEVQVTDQESVPVTLAADDKLLNEVVVTGFGGKTQTRKLAYSIQEVAGPELARAGTVNVVNSLQGKVSGVMINQGIGGPSSSSRIRIRGNTSISDNFNSMPLFVVDGVLIQPNVSGADTWGDNRDFGNQLKNLNPDDYESLTVLKGSAASALYGSQAQNGVILITTKKGKSKPGLGVTVNQQTSWESVYRLPDFQNVYGGGRNQWFSAKDSLGNDRLENLDANVYWSFGPKFDGHIIRDLDGRLVPWQANDLKSIYRTGTAINTNVSVEGGNDKTTVRFSYTNSRNSSIQPNNSFNRNNFALRATQKIGKIIMLDASVNYANSLSRNPILQGGNSNMLFGLSYSNSRNYPIDYAIHNYIDTVKGGRVISDNNAYLRNAMTALFWSNFQVDYRHTENSLLANLDLTASITPWLSLLVRGNLNSINIEDENKVRGDGPRFASTGSFGSYAIGQSSGKNVRVQTILSANKQFGNDLDLSLSAGGETQRDLGGFVSFVSTVGGLKIPEIYSIFNSVLPLYSAADRFPPNYNTNAAPTAKRRLDAIYSYGDLTWRNMLTLSASIRNDRNSTLTYPDGRGTYSYFYPSVGLSWVFSESLRKKKGFDFLSFGKLRASLGYTGSGTNPYTTSAGYYSALGNFLDIDGSNYPRYGFASSDLPNIDLKPEKTREYEIGADLRFLDNRIRLDIAAYKKNTFNQIIFLAAPPETGISTRLINAGNVQNKGIEMLLALVPVRNKNAEWTTTFNFTRNVNKIIDLYPGVKGKIIEYAFLDQVLGMATVGEQFGEIVSPYAFARDGNTGQKLLKANGTYWRSGDIGQGEKSLGTMMEKFLLSNINEVSYKNFNLFVQVDSKIGGVLASATHQYGSQFGAFESTLYGRDPEHGGVEFIDDQGNKRTDGVIPGGVFAPGTKINNIDASGMTYKQAVDEGLVKPLTAANYYNGLASYGTGIREYSVFENSWVALREVSVGYQLPKAFAGRIRFNSLRVSLVGRNLGYFYTTTKDHINPESVQASRSGAFAEYGGLPYVRSYGFSVNAGF